MEDDQKADKKAMLVTGASGFIGSVLANRLSQQNKRVKALVRVGGDISKIQNKNLKISYGDIRDYDNVDQAVEGCDQIVHLAGITKGSLAELNEVNLVGLKNILRAAVKHKVRKVIFLSSIAVYGECLDTTEASSYNPYDDYGRSKVMAEEYIKEFNKKYPLPVVIMRPSHVYGPGGRSNIQQMFQYINRKKYFIFGSGKNLINLVYLEDLLDIIINILEDDKIKSDDFIISGPRPYMLKELSYKIAQVCRVRKPLSLLYSAGYILGGICEVISKMTKKKMPLSRSRVKNLARSRSFRIDKAQRILNYFPSTDFDKTLTESYEYYKNEGLI